jgi:gluconolactonase
MASTSTGTTPDTTATATPGTGGADGMGGAPASSGGTDGMGGAGGAGTAGPPSAVWACPAGITGTPTLTGTPTRVAAVPPADDFNMQNGTWGNVEGPVWVGDALYMSEMSSTPYEPANSDQKKSRLLKLAADGTVSIVMADSGSNGLAVDDAGNLVAGVQKDGSITRFSLSGGEPTVLASMYMGKRFNSPNDLALRSDGTLYFSDPRFNAPSSPPQAQTYVYRLPAGGEAEPIPSAASPQMFDGPNGVMLSLAEDYLYVAASAGKRFAVMADGSIGAGEDFPATNGGDGMGIDCAGNIYVAESNTPNLHVFTAEGDAIGSLVISEFQGVTNVAFGGPEHKTLFVTGHGNGKGLFTLDVGIQGRPY